MSSPSQIALVHMPFAGAHRPSIQCGLLKAILARAGRTVDVVYMNLELAAELGAACYATLNDKGSELLGEWLFAVAAFGDRGDDQAYQSTYPHVDDTCKQLGWSFEDLCRLRRETLPSWVERWAADPMWSAYGVVGFTSTFDQNVAALALARRIKAHHPDVITVFGGANFDGEMGPEYVRACPWIDYAVSGEGDEVLPALIDRIACGQSGAGLPGVTARTDQGVVIGGQAPMVRDLDTLPDPDYGEYFAALTRLGSQRVLGDAAPVLLFESARGCWWGQKHHCTFCGINNLGMAFRSKAPDRVRQELRRQADRYRILQMEAVDNIIDMRYIEQLCRPLAEARNDYQIFYEIKANLTRAQLRLLACAGVTTVQPGIESLSTHILALMRKGTTMLRNVRALKWISYYGMIPQWNLLTGFPGETRADYELQERVIPLLAHLPPPLHAGRIFLSRFAPYFTDPSFPVRDIRPWPAYGLIYPPEQFDLDKIASYFDYEMDDVVEPAELHRLHALVADWQQRWLSPHRPVLAYRRAPDWLQVIDGRDLTAPRDHLLRGIEAAAYELCVDTERSPARLSEQLREHHGATVSAPETETMLNRFCDQGLMLEEDGHYLSLALPMNGNW